MAANSSVLGSIWRRSGYGGGVSNLVCGRGGFVSRSFSSVSTTGRMLPWLMLPPATEDGSMVYKFFSLAENRVLSFNWSDNCLDFDPSDKDAQLVGSSKGWLALMNNRTRQVDLINPITRHHAKLPSLEPLGRVSPSKIILSCSPDEEQEGEYRALIAYNYDDPLFDLDDEDDKLAFCCPGRSDSKWTPIGSIHESYNDSFAYLRRQKLFFCANYAELYAWDLRDPLSPKIMTQRKDIGIEREGDLSPILRGYDLEMIYNTLQQNYLVINEDTDDLFVVRWLVIKDDYDCKKMICDVHRYDPGSGKLRYMDRSLDGLSFFIGDNMNGFALSAKEFPELKPDSIYFVLHNEQYDDNCKFVGGIDVGMFSYKDATVAPCCGVPNFKTISPVPRWFTPNTSS